MKLFLIALLCFFCITAHAQESERILNLGYTPLYPFIFMGDDGRVRGIYVDVLTEALEQRLGYSIQYTSYPYRRLEYSLDKGGIDAYIGVGNTGVNTIKGDVPVAVGMMSVFTYKNHPRMKDIADIEFVSDLDGFKIISHIGDQWALQYLKDYDVESSAENYSQVLRKLAKKRGDIALIYEIIGLNTIRVEDLSGEVVLASRLTTNPVLHELILHDNAKNAQLLAKVDEKLIEMLNDGTTSAIYQAYRDKTDLDIEGLTEENKVRLAHFAGDNVGKAIDYIVSDFNKQKNQAKIKSLFLDVVPYKDTIRYALLSQSPPELFMTWAGHRTRFLVENNFIVPIKMADSMAKQFDAQTLANVTYNGEIYALPINHHIIPIIYNKKIFQKYALDVPGTWDETLAVCRVLQQKHIIPFSLGSKNKWPAQFWFDYLLIRTAGLEFRDQLLLGEKHFVDAKVKNVFRLWAELINNGCMDKHNAENDFVAAAKMVADGRAAMNLMGTWAASLLENNFGMKIGVDFDIASFPKINDQVPDYLMSVQDVLVRSKSNKDAQVNSVLKHFASARTQLIYTNASGALAPNITVDTKKYSELQRKMSRMVREYPNNVTAFDLSTPPLVAEIAMTLFKDFLLNPESIDQLLVEADLKLQEVQKLHSLSF